jgi:hypothetical protein
MCRLLFPLGPGRVLEWVTVLGLRVTRVAVPQLPADGSVDVSEADWRNYRARAGVAGLSALTPAGKGRRRVGEARLRRCCIGTATQPGKLKVETPSRLAFMPRSDDAELLHSAAKRIGVEA